MTGWGQSGPLATEPGHDINYLALTGALAAIGTAEEPVPPLNLVADYGGGAMFACLGVVSALLAAQRSGEGQVIDVAMIDGVELCYPCATSCSIAAIGTIDAIPTCSTARLPIIAAIAAIGAGTRSGSRSAPRR
jgi:hypothetical protein